MPINHSSKYAELTENQFLWIGKIVIEFSNIEYLLKNLLTRLLMTSDFLGRTYTDNLNIAKIQESIENALDIHDRRYGGRIIDSKKIKEIKDLNARISSIRGERNKFAHYCWSRWDDSAIFGAKMGGQVPKHDKPNKDSRKITIDEMEKLYKTAYDIVEDLMKLVYSLPEINEQELLDRHESGGGNSS
jgi:hypothetical protein